MTDEATGQHACLETLHGCFTPLTDPTPKAFSENSKSVFYAETVRLILAPLNHSSHEAFAWVFIYVPLEMFLVVHTRLCFFLVAIEYLAEEIKLIFRHNLSSIKRSLTVILISNNLDS